VFSTHEKRDNVKNRIETGHPRAEYYAKKWLVIFDGGSDQWLYVAKSGQTYVFIEVIDLVAYMGREATEQWAASVTSVDLASATPDMLYSALQYCGATDDPPDMSTESGRLAMAEMLFSCGHKSPLWDNCAGEPVAEHDSASEHSKAFRSLRAQARKEGEAMLQDDARDQALDMRIVNKIGQTAREYAMGDGLWVALRRIQEAGESATPEQRLILGMYAKCEHTLGAGPIPEDLRTS
jgi:hypothetical protein